jgi:tetratricopeptide (TPR) repeat protein
MKATIKFAALIGKPAVAAGICLALCPLSAALALNCQPYWTPEYKCMNGCGCPGGGGGGNANVPPTPPQPSAAEIAARAAAQRAHDLNEAGNKAYAAGNWSAAAKLYIQALTQNPNDAVVSQNLRNTLDRLIGAGGDNIEASHVAAVEIAGQAVRITPNDAATATKLREARAVVLNDAGSKASRAGDLAQAAKVYEQALLLVGPQYDLHIGSIVIKDGIAANLAAVRASTLSNEGMKAFTAGDYARAESLQLQALKIFPNHSGATASLAQIRAALAKERENKARAAEPDTKSETKRESKTEIMAAAPSMIAEKAGGDWSCPATLSKMAINSARFNQPDGHFCIAQDAIPCSGPSRSWACSAGQSCNGDGTDSSIAPCR